MLFALNGVKSVGDKVSDSIIKERENGEYISLFDFLSRTKKYSVGDSTVESLIKTNAFGFTNQTRTTLLKALPTLSKISKDAYKRKMNGQKSIFSLLAPEVAEKVSMPDVEILEDIKDNVIKWEKDLTSMYVSYDPLEDYTEYLKVSEIFTPDMLVKSFDNKEPETMPGKTVYLLGVVGTVNSLQTKTGKFMAKPIIESKTSSVNTIAFPKVYDTLDADLIKVPGNVVIIRGNINSSAEEGVLEVIINQFTDAQKNSYFTEEGVDIYSTFPPGFGIRKELEVDDHKKKGAVQKEVTTEDVKVKPKGLYLKVEKEQVPEISKLAAENKGCSRLYFIYGNNVYLSDLTVSINQNFKKVLKEILSPEYVYDV